jgi:type I restriction enzyme M protein
MPTSDQTQTSSVFQNAASHHSLGLFSVKEIEEVESSLFTKGTKPYLKCFATGKDRPAKPEEFVRQLWIRRLHFKYSYPLNRIVIE